MRPYLPSPAELLKVPTCPPEKPSLGENREEDEEYLFLIMCHVHWHEQPLIVIAKT